MQLSVSKIKPHPLNEQIYGTITDANISNLTKSIDELGLLTPLTLNKDYSCISGHQRLKALNILGIKTAEVVIKDIGEEDIILYLIHSNRQRDKTAGQKLLEAKALYQYYGNNQGSRFDLATSVDSTKVPGDMREKIANEVGTSTNTITRLLYIDKYYPTIIDDIGTNIPLNQAFLQVKQLVDKEILKATGEANNGIKGEEGREISDSKDNFILYNQSCESMEQLEDNSIQFIFSSPPYHLQRDYGVKDSIGEDEDVTTYLNRLMLVMDEAYRVLRPDGCMFLVMGDKMTNGSLNLTHQRLAIKMTDEIGWLCRNELIWRKLNPKPESCRNRFMMAHETIYFFTKTMDYKINLEHLRVPYKEPDIRISRAPKHHLRNDDGRMHYYTANIKSPNGKYPSTTDYADDIIETQRNEPPPYNKNRMRHNAAYPIELVDKFSQACLDRNDRGLDMFCGSGSTLVSVVNHGGYAIGYDIQPEYLQMTRKRILEEAEVPRMTD